MFYKDCNVEDAQFTTMDTLTEKDIANIEEKYDVQVEEQRFVDIDIGDGSILRVCEPTKKINRYQVSSGKDIDSDKDVLINTGYLDENEICIGDSISLNSDLFTVKGDFERPDHYYLTTMASAAFGVQAGKDITFFASVTLKEYTVTITDVIKNDSQAANYCSRENAGSLLGFPEDCYNIVMSEKKMQFAQDELSMKIDINTKVSFY